MKSMAGKRTARIIVATLVAAAAVAFGLTTPWVSAPAQPLAELDTSPM